jgi:hypothetical protein
MRCKPSTRISRTVKGSTAQAGKLRTAQAIVLHAEGRIWLRKCGKFMVLSTKKANFKFENQAMKTRPKASKDNTSVPGCDHQK